MTPTHRWTKKTVGIGGHHWTAVAVSDPAIADKLYGYHQAAKILAGNNSKVVEHLIETVRYGSDRGQWTYLAVPAALREEVEAVLAGRPAPIFTGSDPVDLWRPRTTRADLSERYLPRRLQIQGVLHCLAIAYLRAGHVPPQVYPAAKKVVRHHPDGDSRENAAAGRRFASKFCISKREPRFQEAIAPCGARSDDEVGRLAPDAEESLFLLLGRPRRSGMVPRATVWGSLSRDHVEVYLRTDGRILLTSQPSGTRSTRSADDANAIRERAAYGIKATLLGVEDSFEANGHNRLTVIEQAAEPPRLEPIFDMNHW